MKLIITLATPHKPVLLMDRDLYDFYDVVDEYWEKLRTRKFSRLENVTLVSIGGGARDMLVRPGLSFDKYADLNVLVGGRMKQNLIIFLFFSATIIFFSHRRMLYQMS